MRALTPDEQYSLEKLEESVKTLRKQIENPRAFPHHVDEACTVVETDIRYFRRLFQQHKE